MLKSSSALNGFSALTATSVMTVIARQACKTEESPCKPDPVVPAAFTTETDHHPSSSAIAHGIKQPTR